jgi:hypothetical protein
MYQRASRLVGPQHHGLLSHRRRRRRPGRALVRDCGLHQTLHVSCLVLSLRYWPFHGTDWRPMYVLLPLGFRADGTKLSRPGRSSWAEGRSQVSCFPKSRSKARGSRPRLTFGRVSSAIVTPAQVRYPSLIPLPLSPLLTHVISPSSFSVPNSLPGRHGQVLPAHPRPLVPRRIRWRSSDMGRRRREREMNSHLVSHLCIFSSLFFFHCSILLYPPHLILSSRSDDLHELLRPAPASMQRARCATLPKTSRRKAEAEKRKEAKKISTCHRSDL